MLKIFHTGDVHLDSPFSGFSYRESEGRRRELHSIFDAMMRYATENDADIILISGDLFDSGFVGKDTVDSLCGTFASLRCPVVISPGNHDPFNGGSVYSYKKFPDNVYIFKSEDLSCFTFDDLGLRVFGYAFTSDRLEANPLLRADILPKEGYTDILCAHADISSPLSKYAPVSLQSIERCGFCYSALGHIHKELEPIELNCGKVAYSGMPMGRSFDECGFGGAKFVSIEDGRITAFETVRFSDKRYVEEALDISGAETSDEIKQKITALIGDKGYGKETALCVVLRGVVSPSLAIRTELLESAASGTTALLRVKNDTLPTLDTESLATDLTVKGEFYRILCRKIEEGNEEERRVATEALKIGLAALDGKALM